MGFHATLTTAGRSAVIALQGSLDADYTDSFRKKIEQAASLDVAELVLDMSELQQLSAAGIRTVAYARQQMPDAVAVVIASPGGEVLDALLAADFEDSVAIRT